MSNAKYHVSSGLTEGSSCMESHARKLFRQLMPHGSNKHYTKYVLKYLYVYADVYAE